MLIDFHCHCVPEIDDGSDSIETSLSMLNRLKQLHIKRVIATPHFYARRIRLSNYIELRKNSFEKLKSVLTDAYPDVALGAEIYLEKGISSLDLNELKIENTSYILLELPHGDYVPWAVPEIMKIAEKYQATPILAHVERYLMWYHKKDFNSLFSAVPNSILQINTSAFGNQECFNFVYQLALSGHPLVLGTDAHNITTRKVNYDLAWNNNFSKQKTEVILKQVDKTVAEITSIYK